MEFLNKLPNRLITARELSAITGIAAGTLGNWRSTGRGPAFMKIGGGVFYDHPSFDVGDGSPLLKTEQPYRKSRGSGANPERARLHII